MKQFLKSLGIRVARTAGWAESRRSAELLDWQDPDLTPWDPSWGLVERCEPGLLIFFGLNCPNGRPMSSSDSGVPMTRRKNEQRHAKLSP